MFGGIDIGSNVQTQIPCAFRSGGCDEYENDRGSSLLSAELRKTSKNVRKILRVTVQNVLSSSGENQRGVRIGTGKEVHGIASGNFSDFERQKQKGSTVTDYNAVDENDVVHRWKWNHYWKLPENVIGGASCQHMMSSPAIAYYKHGGTPGVVIWC